MKLMNKLNVLDKEFIIKQEKLKNRKKTKNFVDISAKRIKKSIKLFLKSLRFKRKENIKKNLLLKKYTIKKLKFKIK